MPPIFEKIKVDAIFFGNCEGFARKNSASLFGVS